MLSNVIGGCLVVHQSYQTDVNLEHVIRGNSVVIRCSIPSYVADYISVETWRVDETDIFADQWGIGFFFVCLWRLPIIHYIYHIHHIYHVYPFYPSNHLLSVDITAGGVLGSLFIDERLSTWA